jgi:hypothetical protein
MGPPTNAELNSKNWTNWFCYSPDKNGQFLKFRIDKDLSSTKYNIQMKWKDSDNGPWFGDINSCNSFPESGATTKLYNSDGTEVYGGYYTLNAYKHAIDSLKSRTDGIVPNFLKDNSTEKMWSNVFAFSTTNRGLYLLARVDQNKTNTTSVIQIKRDDKDGMSWYNDIDLANNGKTDGPWLTRDSDNLNDKYKEIYDWAKGKGYINDSPKLIPDKLPGEYFSYYGYDYPFDDLNVFSAANTSDCARKCDTNPDCIGSVYNSNTKMCYTKTNLETDRKVKSANVNIVKKDTKTSADKKQIQDWWSTQISKDRRFQSVQYKNQDMYIRPNQAAAGAPVGIYPSSNGAVWRKADTGSVTPRHLVYANNNSTCLDFDTTSGNAKLATCNKESKTQRWDLTENGELRPEYSGDLCLSAGSAGTDGQQQINVQKCNGNKYQTWILH